MIKKARKSASALDPVAALVCCTNNATTHPSYDPDRSKPRRVFESRSQRGLVSVTMLLSAVPTHRTTRGTRLPRATSSAQIDGAVLRTVLREPAGRAGLACARAPASPNSVPARQDLIALAPAAFECRRRKLRLQAALPVIARRRRRAVPRPCPPRPASLQASPDRTEAQPGHGSVAHGRVTAVSRP